MIKNKLFLSLLSHIYLYRDSELVILYHNYNNYIIRCYVSCMELSIRVEYIVQVNYYIICLSAG